ncbi:hypothetical protein QZH41_019456 [Actinostola sp. cb2023]|nr:hypothetical protein QZH41_019456 [Actinostola sp. cb2023]
MVLFCFIDQEVFICCGGDLSSTPFAWEKLKEANLSYNSINTLDDSVKVLPLLEVLNLSHNNIVFPENDDWWQFLSELKYLNLGYNQLNKVPSVPAIKLPRFQLKILILRNNDIHNLKGIEYFILLETLDVSNNCIASFQELFPVAHLEKLLSLHLAGNPVCYHTDYRMHAVSCMSPFPRRGDMYLDNEKLSPLEKTFVGSSVDPVSPLTYLSTMSTESQDFNESSQDITDQPIATCVTKKKKNRKLKTRHVSIVCDVEDGSNCSHSVVSPQGEPSLDHSQDIERLEKARDLGGAHCLPAVNHVLHGETTEQQPVKEEKMEPVSTSPYFVHHEDVIVDVNPPPIRRKSSSGSQHSDDEGIIQPFIVTPKTMNPTDEDEEEDNDLLVTVTEHFIRERDCDNGKVICKLETGSLLSASLEESEDGDLFVHIKFDYLSRDRKERYYIMDDKENCEQLLELLQPLIKSNEDAKNVIITEHLQCLKCSAYFTENASRKMPRDHICPDCGSTKIIEILSPETINTSSPDEKHNSASSKTDQGLKTEARTEPIWLNEPQKTMPDLIPSVSPIGAYILQPDIHNSNKENTKDPKTKQFDNELEVFKNADRNIDDSNSSEGRVDQKPEDESSIMPDESKNSYSIHTNPGYVINNDAGFIVNKQFVAKSSPPLRTSVLSNSIKNSEMIIYDVERLENAKPSVVTPQKRVIDSPILLKTSTRNTTDGIDGPTSVERESPHRKTSATNQQKVTLSPSSAPNVIKNFFSQLSSKMSGSVLSSSSNGVQEKDSAEPKVPKIESNLVFEISPDEFKDCDHRLKLYFEVSLFTGGQEEFVNCLLKAPVVVYGSTQESSALLVVSNVAVYICKLVESTGYVQGMTSNGLSISSQ